MANAFRANKDRVVLQAGTTLCTQSANPIAAADYGMWTDSNGVFKISSANTAFGVCHVAGVIPSARLNFATNPTNNDTVTIGTKTFTFKTSLVAATTTTQVKILGSAALTLAAFLDAINGVTNANVVLDTTPFTTSIVADAVTATVMRIRKASTQGGTAIAGTFTSTALSETLTAVADIWNCANLNVSGKAEVDAKFTAGQFAITAQMLTNTSYQVELPFTPTAFMAFVTSSTGVQRASTDAVTISGNAINVALGGGASPAIQSGDLIRFWAIS